jgi:hypothetical protein
MPKDFEVTLHYSGSHTFYISAPDDEEAIGVAYDELANLIDPDFYEVTDSESCQVDGGYDG